jgi:hypothetical protein
MPTIKTATFYVLQESDVTNGLGWIDTVKVHTTDLADLRKTRQALFGDEQISYRIIRREVYETPIE